MERFGFELIRVISAIVVVWGCSNLAKEQRVQPEIYNDVVYELLDTLVERHNLQHSKIIHYDIYPDKLKTKILESTIEELSSDSSIKTTLIKQLKTIVQDSVILSIKKQNRVDYEFIFEISEIKQEIRKKDPRNITLNLSPISLNEDETIGCFYAGINCGKKCSAGYYVFVKKEEDKWGIRGIIRNWYSKNFKGVS